MYRKSTKSEISLSLTVVSHRTLFLRLNAMEDIVWYAAFWDAIYGWNPEWIALWNKNNGTTPFSRLHVRVAGLCLVGLMSLWCCDGMAQSGIMGLSVVEYTQNFFLSYPKCSSNAAKPWRCVLDSYSTIQIPPKQNQLKSIFSIEHYIVAQ